MIFETLTKSSTSEIICLFLVFFVTKLIVNKWSSDNALSLNLKQFSITLWYNKYKLLSIILTEFIFIFSKYVLNIFIIFI